MLWMSFSFRVRQKEKRLSHWNDHAVLCLSPLYTTFYSFPVNLVCQNKLMRKKCVVCVPIYWSYHSGCDWLAAWAPGGLPALSLSMLHLSQLSVWRMTWKKVVHVDPDLMSFLTNLRKLNKFCKLNTVSRRFWFWSGIICLLRGPQIILIIFQV